MGSLIIFVRDWTSDVSRRSFESVFPSFSVVFPLLRNLEISTQESNANSTEISTYKTQFSTCKKGQEGYLSKHCSRNVLKQ